MRTFLRILLGSVTLCVMLGMMFDRKAVSVKCPVDQTSFSAWDITSSNDWGGADADFCRHPYHGKSLTYLVWVCPKCYYAADRKQFDKLEHEDAKSIHGRLKPMAPIKKDAQQEDIPGWVKYDLAAQVMTLTGKSRMEIGKMQLNAAWAARQEGAPDLEGYTEFEDVLDRYKLSIKPIDLKENRTEYDLKKVKELEAEIRAGKKYKDNDLLLATYAAAVILRKHGENPAAQVWMDALKKEKGRNSILDDAVQKMEETVKLEKQFQKSAAEAFEATLQEDKLNKDAADLQYILGELYRRMNDTAAAEKWYKTCIDNDSASASYKAMAQYQMDKMLGVVPQPK